MSLDNYVKKLKRKMDSESDFVLKKKKQADEDPPPSDTENCEDQETTNLTTNTTTEKDEKPADASELKSPNESGADVRELVWRNLRKENLKCDYVQLYTRQSADDLFRRCEKEIEYNTGQLSKVKVFGKWHNIPRQQVAHGDRGLKYSFSGKTVPARPWIPLLEEIHKRICEAAGYSFNFVLVNRYKDGSDHIGEHKDDERDLVPGHPIASLTLGQARDFVFKHQDARGKNAKRKINPVTIELTHGCLLMMCHPTNSFWYHSLPPRKKLTGVRINMTFRKMVT